MRKVIRGYAKDKNRQRPSRVTSVGQDPNLTAPVAHLSYLNLPVASAMTIRELCPE
jgi:hypothetical protein